MKAKKNVIVPYSSMVDRVAEPMSVVGSYARGVDALRSRLAQDNNRAHPVFVTPNGSQVYRPLTFRENIEAFVNDFETQYDPIDGHKRSMDKRSRLCTQYLDSCTGIVTKKRSTKFKIVPLSSKLVALKRDFSEPFVSIRYSSVEGVELDSSIGKYNQGLFKDESIALWTPLLEGDESLSRAHADIVFQNFDTGRGVYVRQNTPQDELRVLVVGSFGDDSNANTWGVGIGSSRFLLVSRRKKY